MSQTTSTADETPLMQRLQMLEDKEAITNMFHKYLHFVDTKINASETFTAAELAEFVTDDFVEDAGPFGKNEPGHKGMADFLNGVGSGFQYMRHTVSCMALDVDGDNATYQCNCNVYATMADTPVVMCCNIKGKCRRTADGWRCSETMPSIDYFTRANGPGWVDEKIWAPGGAEVEKAPVPPPMPTTVVTRTATTDEGTTTTTTTTTAAAAGE